MLIPHLFLTHLHIIGLVEVWGYIWANEECDLFVEDRYSESLAMPFVASINQRERPLQGIAITLALAAKPVRGFQI